MTQHGETPRGKFQQAISGPDADIDMTLASLYIAAEEYPALDIDAYVARVDSLAQRAKTHLRRYHGVYDALHAVNRVLFDEDGFSGNRENYYDPRNSYFCDVLDRRTGIPISLSVLYSEIARRIGYRLDAVGLPGHFVLRAGRGEAELYVDPYDRGGFLTVKECKQLVAKSTRRELDITPYLKPLGPRRTLYRALNNLKMLYMQADDRRRALAAAERMQLIEPDSWENLGDLAKLQTDLGDFAAATESLTRYLELAPMERDTSSARAALDAIRDGKAGPGGNPR